MNVKPLLWVIANIGQAEWPSGENPFIMNLWANLGLKPQHDEGLEWCGAMAAEALRQAPETMQVRSPRPVDFTDLPQCDPAQGCVCVKWQRRQGGGRQAVHVGFLAGTYTVGSRRAINVAAGNQPGVVSLSGWQWVDDNWSFHEVR